jgi:hypothetical protein
MAIDENDKIYFVRRIRQDEEPDIHELWTCNMLTNEWNRVTFFLPYDSPESYYIVTRIHVRRQKLYIACLDTGSIKNLLLTVSLNELYVSDTKEVPVDNRNYVRCYDFVEEKMFFFIYDKETSLLSSISVYDIDQNAWTEIDTSHVRFVELEYPMTFQFFVINDAFLVREISGKIEIYELKSGRLVHASKEPPWTYKFAAKKDSRLYFECNHDKMYVFDCIRFEWIHFVNNNESPTFTSDWYMLKVLCSQNSSKLYYLMCDYVNSPDCPCNCCHTYKEIKDVYFAIASTIPLSLQELATLKVREKMDISDVRKVVNNIL